MRKLLVFGPVLAAAFATSGASAALPTGDSCTASGSGTAYTLQITIPGSAPEQGGFAVGALGGKVMGIASTDVTGTRSTSSLPSSTSIAWLLPSPALPGSVTIAVKTTNPVARFRVDAANAQATQFIDRFACVVSPATAPLANNHFSAARVATYDRATRSWHLMVSVPAAGLLSATQQVAANQVMAPRTLVVSSRIATKSPGQFALTLRLTGAGKKALTASNSLHVRLGIAFAPRNGLASSSLVDLTLAR